MIKNVFILGITTAIFFYVVGNNVSYVNAQTCPFYNEVPPSRSYRTFQYKKYNIAFEVPDNYHVTTWVGKTLEVQSPQAYQEIQCLVRNKIGTDNLPNTISFYIEEAPPDLDTWVGERVYGYEADSTPAEYRSVTITSLGGRSALQYYTEGPTGFMTNISVIDLTGKYVITISTHQSASADEEYDAEGNLVSFRSVIAEKPSDAEVFNRVLSSFCFL